MDVCVTFDNLNVEHAEDIGTIEVLMVKGEKGDPTPPTDAQVKEAVEETLEEHPEWTTTVEDKSITYKKLTDELYNQILAAYATDTASGTIATFQDGADDVPVKSAIFAINPVQEGSGDPSPTNVRPIIGWDKAQILQSQLAEISAANGRLIFSWKDGNTEYNPEMNLCLVTDAELADSSAVHGAFFEWDKTMPFGVPYDPPEAIYYFDGTEGAGTFHISIGMAYGNGWKTTKHIQFTLNVAPAEGDQLVINCATSSDTDPTNGRTWNLYAKGSTTSKDTGTTSDGTGGTNLGSTDSSDVGKANGRVNAPQRIVYGYNRWSQSFLRQYLNATAESGWYAAANPWDRPDATVMAKAGFLYGYGAEVYSYFKPIKVVTVACNADSNVEDVTYDRVFLSSLEQMYCVPQFSGKEGSYWEYYKRLLGRTSPAPTSATYARLIKYALNAPTSAQRCWRRSATRYSATIAWLVTTSGDVNAVTACGAYRCAPSVFISAEDIKITDITWSSVGTVYGGTLEYLGGERWRLTRTHKMITYNGTESWLLQTERVRCKKPSDAADQATTIDKGAVSNVAKLLYATTIGAYFSITNSYVYINLIKTGETLAEFKARLADTNMQIVYPLATPQTYDLTADELRTLLGTNNVWSDTGSAEVEYRADTALYIQKMLSSNTQSTLFISRPTLQTTESAEVEEGQDAEDVSE